MSPWIKGYHRWYLTMNCKVILGHFGYINKISQNLRACCLIFQMNRFPVTCWDSLLMGSMFLMNSVPNGRKNGVILSWWGRWTNDFAEMLHQPAPTFVSDKSFAMFTSVCMQHANDSIQHEPNQHICHTSIAFCSIQHIQQVHVQFDCLWHISIFPFPTITEIITCLAITLAGRHIPPPSRHELICQRSPPSASYRRSEATS